MSILDTFYLFLVALVLKDYSMNRKDLTNLFKRSMDGLLLLSGDYLVLRTTMMGYERFMITICFAIWTRVERL